jgi:hypothetical protein
MSLSVMPTTGSMIGIVMRLSVRPCVFAIAFSDPSICPFCCDLRPLPRFPLTPILNPLRSQFVWTSVPSIWLARHGLCSQRLRRTPLDSEVCFG